MASYGVFVSVFVCFCFLGVLSHNDNDDMRFAMHLKHLRKGDAFALPILAATGAFNAMFYL